MFSPRGFDCLFRAADIAPEFIAPVPAHTSWICGPSSLHYRGRHAGAERSLSLHARSMIHTYTHTRAHARIARTRDSRICGFRRNHFHVFSRNIFSRKKRQRGSAVATVRDGRAAISSHVTQLRANGPAFAGHNRIVSRYAGTVLIIHTRWGECVLCKKKREPKYTEWDTIDASSESADVALISFTRENDEIFVRYILYDLFKYSKKKGEREREGEQTLHSSWFRNSCFCATRNTSIARVSIIKIFHNVPCKTEGKNNIPGNCKSSIVHYSIIYLRDNERIRWGAIGEAIELAAFPFTNINYRINGQRANLSY